MTPMTDSKKPGMAFWAIVVVVAGLIGYPLSVGPLILLVRLDWLPEPAMELAAPVYWVMYNGPEWLCWALALYIGLWC
jgi:hypothetical protein